MKIRMDTNAKMEKLMTEFARHVRRPVQELKFYNHDGTPIMGDRTPAYYDLRDGDVIDVGSYLVPGCLFKFVCPLTTS